METTSPALGAVPREVTVNSAPECQTLQAVHQVSVVVPVYRGEATLGPLVAEIEPLTRAQGTARGHRFRVAEVILVHDGAVDNSGAVMEALAERHPFVKLVWLSRNFGQHPATLAGAASTTSEWVVTIDEDGEQNPAEIGNFLDRALETGSQLVYARPTNAAPHGWSRNLLSALVKRLFISFFVSNPAVFRFHSFRLVQGEIARSLAAYCGYNVYLDVALSWVVARSTHCPVTLRKMPERRSGYSWRRLVGHFGRLVLSSGTRPLRLISLLGVSSIWLALAVSAYALWGWLAGKVPVQGWTSVTILLCFFSGCMLFSLGVIAEYLGIVLSMAVGKPLYLAVSRPNPKKGLPP